MTMIDAVNLLICMFIKVFVNVYVVLVLKVIRFSCHYFLDRIIFHHDFLHDSCDYHWDFYGH